jgi:hypothetical protein
METSKLTSEHFKKTAEAYKKLAEINMGLAEGRTLQTKEIDSDGSFIRWVDCRLCDLEISDLGYYRLKPIPYIRPWTKKEAPLNIIIVMQPDEWKREGFKVNTTLCAASRHRDSDYFNVDLHKEGEMYTQQLYFKQIIHLTYLLPHGSPQPCGVLVEE